MPSVDTAQIVQSQLTISDKIRRLNEAGCSRREIADLLDRSYQHVRQVLVDDERRARRRSAQPSLSPMRLPDENRPPVRIGNLFRLTVEAGGKVQLPTEVLRAFNLEDGRIVVADLGDGVFTLMSSEESLRRARAMIPQWRPGEPLWSEEVIEERRREAAAEEADG